MTQKTKTLPLATAGLCDTSFPDRIDKPNNTATHASGQSQLRRQRHIGQLHALGPQPLFYFLLEIESGADIDATLAAYSRLSPALIAAYGGDQFPAALHVVEGGRHE
jgi:hypothetical protein